MGHLALALGSSLTAGLNLYITVLTLGLLGRLQFVSLPADMEVLTNGWVLLTAAVLFLIEALADKIPYIDNTWDMIHGFIRVPAGALLAVAAMSDLPSELVWIAALLGGFTALAAHGAKATTRLAVNSTPEPFTNWFLSLLEDGLSLTLLWLVFQYPAAAIILALLLLALFVFVIVIFFHFFKTIFQRPPAAAVHRS